MNIAGTELETRLRRIEGKLDMLLNAADIEAADRDVDGEIAKAYRRGYVTGHHAARRGDTEDADGALRRRRRTRS
jgi:hypothetical protein